MSEFEDKFQIALIEPASERRSFQQHSKKHNKRKKGRQNEVGDHFTSLRQASERAHQALERQGITYALLHL